MPCRLFFYEKTGAHVTLHEAYAIKGKRELAIKKKIYQWSFIYDSTILGGYPKLLNVGTWTVEHGLEIPTKSVYERRKNLTGVTLITSVNSWSPVSILEEDVNSELHQSGTKSIYVIIIFTYMSMLNMGCNIQNLPDFTTL